MGIELRLLECFLAVARERSFTRASIILGIQQSAASERLQRLEAVLGFPLLTRTSRRVELSAGGLQFLPHAERLLATEQDLLRAARRIQVQLANVLRIGGCEYQATLPARRRLIDLFMLSHPEINLEIHHGAVPHLIDQLRAQEIDVVLSLNLPHGELKDIQIRKFGTQCASVYMPVEDPLAAASELPIAALGGRLFFLSPGRHDPGIIGHLKDRLSAVGVRVETAPEADRVTIEHCARVRRGCCLRWHEQRMASYREGDMQIVPIAGDIFVTSFEAARLTTRSTRALDSFFETIARMPEHHRTPAPEAFNA